METKEAITILSRLKQVAEGLVGMIDELKERVTYVESCVSEINIKEPVDYSQSILEAQKLLVITAKRQDTIEENLHKIKAQMSSIIEIVNKSMGNNLVEPEIECDDKATFDISKNKVMAKPDPTKKESKDEPKKDINKELEEIDGEISKIMEKKGKSEHTRFQPPPPPEEEPKVNNSDMDRINKEWEALEEKANKLKEEMKSIKKGASK